MNAINNSKIQTSIKDFFKSNRKYLKKSDDSKSDLPVTALAERCLKRKFDIYSKLDISNYVNQQHNYASSSATKRKLSAAEISSSDKDSIDSDYLSVHLPENLLSKEDKIKTMCYRKISQYQFLHTSASANVSIEFASSGSSNSEYSKLTEHHFETFEHISNASPSSIFDSEHWEDEEDLLKNASRIDSDHDLESQENQAQLLFEKLLYDDIDSTLSKRKILLSSWNSGCSVSSPASEINASQPNGCDYEKSDGDAIESDCLLQMSPFSPIPSEANDEVGNDNSENANKFEKNSNKLFEQGILDDSLELEGNTLCQEESEYLLFQQSLQINKSVELSRNSMRKSEDQFVISTKSPERSKSQQEFESENATNESDKPFINFVPYDDMEIINQPSAEFLTNNENSQSKLINLQSVHEEELDMDKNYDCIPDGILSQISVEDETRKSDFVETTNTNSEQGHFCQYQNLPFINELNHSISFSNKDESDHYENLGEDLEMITGMLDKMDEYFINNLMMVQESDAVSVKNTVETINWKHFLRDQDNLQATEVNEIFRKSCMELVSSEQLLRTGDVEEELSLEDRRKLVLKNMSHELKRLFQNALQNVGMHFKYKNNTSWDNLKIEKDILVQRNDEEAKFTFVKKSVKNGCAKFHLMFDLLKKIFHLVTKNERITKREIYYEFNQIQRKPRTIYDALTAISCVLKVPLWYCNIYSTSKGLAYGDLIITIDGKDVNYNIKGGTLIPNATSIITKIVSRALFILVVEKDAIFQKLLDEDVSNKLTQPFLLVTGKGYADMSTQLFIKKIWMQCKIPAFIIVDADPNGIEIVLTYKFGSLNLAHCSSYLALPQLRWIGVFPSELKHLNINSKPLTDRDTKKIKALLKRPYMKLNYRFELELQHLLNGKIKAEIEGLIQNDKYLSETYIPEKLCGKDFC